MGGSLDATRSRQEREHPLSGVLLARMVVDLTTSCYLSLLVGRRIPPRTYRRADQDVMSEYEAIAEVPLEELIVTPNR